MSKPYVSHPKNTDIWRHDSLIVQAFHTVPARVKVHVLDGDGARTIGRRLISSGTLALFLFEELPDDSHTVHVKDQMTAEENDRVEIVIASSHNRKQRAPRKRFLNVPQIFSPPGNGSHVYASFVAWGVSDPNGGDLVGLQTMTGTNNGAVTNGVISMQPSSMPGTWYWSVHFAITDNPFQNPYTLRITNGSGTSTRTGLIVDPMP